MEVNVENLEKLISQLGKDLEQGKKPTLSSDPILALLDSYKNNAHEVDDESIPSAALWGSIQKQTTAKSAPIFSLSFMKYIAVAAALILGLAFAYTNFVSNTNSVLLESTLAEYKTVQIESEAEVLLRSYSSLTEIENNDENYTLSLVGEAQFKVKKRKKKLFKIKTPQGSIEVLGTTFTVKTDSLESLVYLAEGKVRVQSVTGNEFILMPDEAIRISSDGSISIIPSSESELFTAWINHEIYLNSRTANDVIKEIERHYAMQIYYPEEPNEKLSGVLKLGSKDQVLKDIGLVLGGEFKKETETRYSWIKRE